MQSLETWNHGWEESPNHTGRELFVHESCNLQIRAIDFCSSSKVVQKIPTPLTDLQVHAWVESSFYLKTLGSIITIWKDDPGKKKRIVFKACVCMHPSLTLEIHCRFSTTYRTKSLQASPSPTEDFLLSTWRCVTPKRTFHLLWIFQRDSRVTWGFIEQLLASFSIINIHR